MSAEPRIIEAACPFCRVDRAEERAVGRDGRLGERGPWQVACSCGASGSHADTPDDAVRAWNEATRLTVESVEPDPWDLYAAHALGGSMAADPNDCNAATTHASVAAAAADALIAERERRTGS